MYFILYIWYLFYLFYFIFIFYLPNIKNKVFQAVLSNKTLSSSKGLTLQSHTFLSHSVDFNNKPVFGDWH